MRIENEDETTTTKGPRCKNDLWCYVKIAVLFLIFYSAVTSEGDVSWPYGQEEWLQTSESLNVHMGMRVEKEKIRMYEKYVTILWNETLFFMV